jgi:hypothetical protein
MSKGITYIKLNLIKIFQSSLSTYTRHSWGFGVLGSKTKLNEVYPKWIEPNQLEIAPSYEQKSIPNANKDGKLCLVASSDGESGSVSISADAKMYAGLFNGNQTATLKLDPVEKHMFILFEDHLR